MRAKSKSDSFAARIPSNPIPNFLRHPRSAPSNTIAKLDETREFAAAKIFRLYQQKRIVLHPQLARIFPHAA